MRTCSVTSAVERSAPRTLSPDDVLAGRDGGIREVADETTAHAARDRRLFVEERLAVGRHHGQNRSPAAAPFGRPRRRAIQFGDHPEQPAVAGPRSSGADAQASLRRSAPPGPPGVRSSEASTRVARGHLRIERRRRGRARRHLGGRGGAVPPPRAQLDARALHAHVDAPERPVGLRVGRRVPDQVVVRQIRDHPLQRRREVVALDHREAVGRAGRRLQRLEPSAQPRDVVDDALGGPTCAWSAPLGGRRADSRIGCRIPRGRVDRPGRS